MKSIHVDVEVKPLSYEVYIGTEILGCLAQDLAGRPLGKRYAVIADSQVAALHGEKMMGELKAAGLSAQMFVFPAGEASKNRRVKERLEDEMLDAGFGRDSAVIAFGGGVTGDLAGFVAATYMRGLPVIQVPTTTLSMADSAIGSKTAVDVPQGKNLIGAFHSPVAVYMDMKLLDTLDERNYYSGLVELIKHGLIRRPSLQEYLEEHQKVVTGREGDAAYYQTMEELLERNSEVKNDVVCHDQKESNLRKLLNYGHTFGHGVELVSHFNLLHGECVAVGIAFAAFLAEKLGYAQPDWTDKQIRTLEAYHQSCAVAPDLPVEEMIAAMKKDKKVRDGKIEFILLSGPAQVVCSPEGKLGVPVDETELRKWITEFRQWKRNKN